MYLQTPAAPGFSDSPRQDRTCHNQVLLSGLWLLVFHETREALASYRVFPKSQGFPPK